MTIGFFLDFFILYLNGFCYSAVSLAIFWRSEFIKTSWCLSNICIICIGALYSWTIRGFWTGHMFVINSSIKNVNNFCVTEIRYVFQRKYSKSKVFYPYSQNLNITPRSPTSPTMLFLVPKKPKLVSVIIYLLAPEAAH